MADLSDFVVGVRFSDVGKIYHFDPGDIPDLDVGDAVIVETSRGCQLGMVACLIKKNDLDSKGGWKNIDRKATPRDLMIRQLWTRKEKEVVRFSMKLIKEINLGGFKVVQAEYSFDGERLTVMVSNESEEKFDLKPLRKELQKRYSSAQVEVRQIGPRDVAKIVCGMGACGLEKRCCCEFLSDFKSISIRMAKNQGISLTPAEITGMCGRLRCCLFYEHEQYAEALRGIPKRNKRIKTPQGVGKIIEIRALKDEIVVDIPEVGKRIFSKEDILSFKENQ